jgi:hypothetical protein
MSNHSIMRPQLTWIIVCLFALLLPTAAMAGVCRFSANPEQLPPECGAVLLKNGWQKIAQCDDGHQWSYILQKAGAQKYCQGINALAGPEEDICQNFTGDIAAFRQLLARGKAQTAAYDKAKRENRLDAYLLENIKSKTHVQVSCWLKPEQINATGVAR